VKCTGSIHNTQSQEHCSQPARQGDTSHCCLNLVLTSDEQDQIVLGCSYHYLSGVPLQLFGDQIFSSFCTAAGRQQIFLPFLFVFLSFLISDPIFFALLLCSPHQRLRAAWAGGHPCTDTWEPILCQKNIWGKQVLMNSRSRSPPYSISLQSIFLFLCLTPLL